MKKTIKMYTAVTGILLLPLCSLNAQTKTTTAKPKPAATAATPAPAPAPAAKPQEVKKAYPEPSTQEKVYLYTEETNEADDLQTAYLSSGDRSTGFKTKEDIYMAPGEKSPVRVKKSAQIKFLVMFYDATFDPTKNYRLMKLNINAKKQRRECVIGKSNEWTGTNNTSIAYLPYSQKKVVDKTKDDGVVRMLIVENLEPGEYVWTNGWGEGDAWFFGVDE